MVIKFNVCQLHLEIKSLRCSKLRFRIFFTIVKQSIKVRKIFVLDNFFWADKAAKICLI